MLMYLFVCSLFKLLNNMKQYKAYVSIAYNFIYTHVKLNVNVLFDMIRCPPFAIDVLSIHTKLVLQQVTSLFSKENSIGSWFAHQFEVFRLVWFLERFHQLEIALDKRLGYGVLSAELPHVDSQAGSTHRPTNQMSSNAAMGTGPPIVKDIVLVGGGHSHAFVVKSFGMRPVPGVRVTLISNDVETPYSGMLPGHIAGHYSRAECHIDLVRLGKFGGARMILGNVHHIDRENKLIHLTSNGEKRPPISYDILSINVGSSPNLSATKSLISNPNESISITPVKPISSFAQKWDELLESIRDRCKTDTPTTIGVVGAGAGGVELALAMQYRLKNEAKRVSDKGDTLIKMILFSRSSVVCPAHNTKMQKTMLRILKKRKIKVYLNFDVCGIERDMVVSKTTNEKVPVDDCIWCTMASAQSWIGKSGFAVDEAGFIKVDDTLQSVNTPGVFAAGDIACMINQPRPKAGVFAVRQGPPLNENLRAFASNEPLSPYIAQSAFLGILGTGEPYAVASKGELALEGEWLWYLKDWIDRKWMAGYTSQLPEMPEPEIDPIIEQVRQVAGADAIKALGEVSMRCGGCGSKVGATVLSNVMNKLEKRSRPEVLVGLDAPDDCAVVNFSKDLQGPVAVQSVDFFRSFIDDPYIFGKIVANHSLSDCHAMGVDAVTAMAIAVVPYGLERKVEDMLYQMMSGTTDFLKEDGCVLVGGHTCEGAELSMGLSVTGSSENVNNIMHKGGVLPGQSIIVTKAIGTGTLMAAHMRVKAKGIWVSNALDSMLQSNKTAAHILASYGASACTDITGFGVIGHLVETLKASTACGATIYMDNVPLLPGALECVRAGIFSSLQPQNIRLKRTIANESDAIKHEAYPLLFDPQTAGGLLATVPTNNLNECLSELKQNGYVHAQHIGNIVPEMENGKLIVVE